MKEKIFIYVKDNDRFCKIHVNTINGVWSLLRSGLGLRRGISRKVSFYLVFFEFVHNSKNQGKGLLDAFIGVLVS
jgi:transposase